MSALSRFLQKNQITSSSPLPLVHTTESYHLKKIIGTSAIVARPCDVFVGEKLSSFFVGRAAYKRQLGKDPEYWELPACLVLEFFVDGMRRIFPFDSGAFKSRYPEYIRMMELSDFEVVDDYMAPHKLIGTFFRV